MACARVSWEFLDTLSPGQRKAQFRMPIPRDFDYQQWDEIKQVINTTQNTAKRSCYLIYVTVNCRSGLHSTISVHLPGFLFANILP